MKYYNILVYPKATFDVLQRLSGEGEMAGFELEVFFNKAHYISCRLAQE